MSININNILVLTFYLFVFKDLLKFVREEVVAVHKRTDIQPVKAETSLEPYELYKIDFHLFETLFTAISPLGRNNEIHGLGVRLFKVFITLINVSHI